MVLREEEDGTGRRAACAFDPGRDPQMGRPAGPLRSQLARSDPRSEDAAGGQAGLHPHERAVTKAGQRAAIQARQRLPGERGHLPSAPHRLPPARDLLGPLVRLDRGRPSAGRREDRRAHRSPRARSTPYPPAASRPAEGKEHRLALHLSEPDERVRASGEGRAALVPHPLRSPASAENEALRSASLLRLPLPNGRREPGRSRQPSRSQGHQIDRALRPRGGPHRPPLRAGAAAGRRRPARARPRPVGAEPPAHRAVALLPARRRDDLDGGMALRAAARRRGR